MAHSDRRPAAFVLAVILGVGIGLSATQLFSPLALRWLAFGNAGSEGAAASLASLARKRAGTSPTQPTTPVWDGRAVIDPAAPANLSICRWRTANWVSIVPVSEVCIRTPGDLLSDIVFAEGHWRDCEILVRILDGARPHPPGAIFVEAGANIGMCTVRVASLDVATIAFEPLPANLFYLTSSLMRNPSLKALVTLHAVGLSEAPGTAVMYSQANNYGNSVIGQPLADNPNDANMVAEMRKRASTITLSTLDSELWPDASLPPPLILLLKIDVQGFEVHAFRGAARLFAACAIKRIKSEMDFGFLRGAGTPAEQYCALLREHGFVLYTESGAPVMCGEGIGGAQEFIALLDKNECARRHPKVL